MLSSSNELVAGPDARCGSVLEPSNELYRDDSSVSRCRCSQVYSSEHPLMGGNGMAAYGVISLLVAVYATIVAIAVSRETIPVL